MARNMDKDYSIGYVRAALLYGVVILALGLAAFSKVAPYAAPNPNWAAFGYSYNCHGLLLTFCNNFDTTSTKIATAIVAAMFLLAGIVGFLSLKSWLQKK